MYKTPGVSMRWICALSIVTGGCGTQSDDTEVQPEFAPSAIVDLGALVTEDLPERVWGTAFLTQMGFTRGNEFDVIAWNFPMGGEEVHGSNAYYTLFNHGGPHVDAPNHMGVGGGVDSYAVEAFVGPLRVFDARAYPSGRSIPRSLFEGLVQAGDVVIILTGYVPPQANDQLPEVATLTNEAAEYLAALPARAIGTDAFSIDSLDDVDMPSIHHVFLTRGIPVYEQLFNVETLIGHERMWFVGAPLNILGGDGMMVRPLVFVY